MIAMLSDTDCAWTTSFYLRARSIRISTTISTTRTPNAAHDWH